MPTSHMPQPVPPEGWACQEKQGDALSEQQVRMVKKKKKNNSPHDEKAGRLPKPTSHQACPRYVHIFCPSEGASMHQLVSKEFFFLKTSIMAPALVFR